MDDRDLLERAARVAGYGKLTQWADRITDHDSQHYGRSALHEEGPAGQCFSWNPLENDGDAFRLMDALKISTEWDFYRGSEGFVSAHSDKDRGFIHETADFDGDTLAATRRAIVRAAAAMEAP